MTQIPAAVVAPYRGVPHGFKTEVFQSFFSFNEGLRTVRLEIATGLENPLNL